MTPGSSLIRRALLVACLALAAAAPGALADPLGSMTDFSAGLNPGSRPGTITPGPDGNLWFADTGTQSAIGRITPTGTITQFHAGLNPGSLPGAIVAGPDGNLWFTDQTDPPAIGRIPPTGTIPEFTGGLNP